MAHMFYVDKSGPGNNYVTVTITPQSFSSTLQFTVQYSFDDALQDPDVASFREKLTLSY